MKVLRILCVILSILCNSAMIKRLISGALLFGSSMILNSMFGQTPELRHVFDIRAEITDVQNLGKVPHGERVVIPITGGEVTGELKGKVLPGGADYQLVDTIRKRTELKAIYTVLADDGTLINVVNEGINSYQSGEYYFITNPRFECDQNSRYAWLNNRIFVCRPVAFENGAIVLRVWEVK